MKRRDFVLSALALGLAHKVGSAPQKTKTGFVYDDRYLKHKLGLLREQPHPESPERLRKIIEAMRAAGLDQEVTRLSVAADPLPSIKAHHTEEHVASIQKIPVTGPVAELAVAFPSRMRS